MDKYLSRQQMQTILDSRPKGVPIQDALNMYVSNGWTVEGVNEPKSTLDEAKDVAVGFGKGLGRTALKTTSTLQDVGQLALGTAEQVLTSGASFGGETKELSETTALQPNVGLETLKTETPQGQELAQKLEPTNAEQKLGGQLETGAEILLGGGAQLLKSGVVKGAQILAPKVAKVKGALTEAKEAVLDKISSEVDVADIISDPLNKAGRTDLLKMTGKTTKKGETLGVEKKGVLGEVKPVQTKSDLEKVENVKEYITSSDPIEQIGNLNRGASDISESIIRPALRANKSFFNSNELNKKLKAVEVPRLFKTDKVLENTYNEVRKMMVETTKKYPKTKEGLYDARIDFDQAVKREFGDVAFDDPKRSVIRRAIQDMRRETNNIIGEGIPDEVFKKQLKRQSDIYEAAENIAEKNNNILDTNYIQRWFKDNPTKGNLIKYVAPSVAGTGFLLQ